MVSRELAEAREAYRLKPSEANAQRCEELYKKEHPFVEVAAIFPPHPMRYEISTDEMVPVTQEDWDKREEFLSSLRKINEALKVPDETSSKPFKFQLACYPNLVHLGRVFIAEAKEIKPYPGLRFGGEVYYPPVPETPWVINSGVDQDFALEIVRRWNRVPGQY